MIDPPELRTWLDSLSPCSAVAVADDGLTLVEIDSHDRETGAYIEVGGPPRPSGDHRPPTTDHRPPTADRRPPSPGAP